MYIFQGIFWKVQNNCSSGDIWTGASEKLRNLDKRITSKKKKAFTSFNSENLKINIDMTICSSFHSWQPFKINLLSINLAKSMLKENDWVLHLLQFFPEMQACVRSQHVLLSLFLIFRTLYSWVRNLFYTSIIRQDHF